LDSEVVQEDALFKVSFSKGNTNTGCIPDLAGLELNLPDTVSGSITAKPGDNSYFTIDIEGVSILAGANIPAWCVDVDLSLGIEGPLDFAVYSSYEELPVGDFENPDNFDLVNWILNQSFIGSASPSGGNYTYGHIQWAIWELIDDVNCVNCIFLTDPTGDWNNDPDNIIKGQEIVQLAIDNGEGFVPQCGELIGVVLIPEGKQPIVITVEVPTLECGDCEGKITELELEYNGPATANIVVKGKAKKKQTPIIFEGTVNPGESFTIYGYDKKGTLGTEIKIYVDGSENAKIHTSCSDPDVGPGYIKGYFTVIRGASREGGELCPSDNPGGGDDCGDCKGKITELELEYNGPATADIVVKGKGKKKQTPIIFEGTVNPGESFTIYGYDKKGTLGTEIKIYVDGSINAKIHTSCSDPDVGPGYTKGYFTVIRGASREGGELCPSDNPGGGDDCGDCKGKITELELEYNGPATADIVVKGKGKKKQTPIIFEGTVNPGESFTIYGYDKKGTLGTEIKIYVDGSENAKIHTSCSDSDVGPGYIKGYFTVIRGASREGGELCPFDNSGGV
jgi:glutaredoxin